MSKFFSEKNAEFINANDRNFQVLRNLILQKRAKFALIYSLKVSQIYKPYGLFFTPAHFNCVEIFSSLSGVVRAGISGLTEITTRLKMKKILSKFAKLNPRQNFKNRPFAKLNPRQI